MRIIRDNLLYDTDKSELIHKDIIIDESLYMTKNKRLFRIRWGRIPNDTQEELKNYLGSVNPNKYIELFGEVEDA